MNSKSLRVISTVVIGLGVLLYLVAQLFGERINEEQTLGCLLVGGFMLAVSTAFFLRGVLPFRAMIDSDPKLKRAFWFACGSLISSIFQIRFGQL